MKITLTDVNDNKPVFAPSEYHVNVRDDASTNAPIALVRATDADAAHLGVVSYRLAAGNDDNLFRVDRVSGELFAVRATKSLSASRQYVLNISATDGAGVKYAQEAQAFITTVANGIRFERARYVFNVSEDAPLNTPLGNVKINALSNGKEIYIMRTYFLVVGLFCGSAGSPTFSSCGVLCNEAYVI